MDTDWPSLRERADSLQRGDVTVGEYVTERFERIAAVESDVRAWVDGPKPREWVQAEATALAERYPDLKNRPPLYGIPVGVKDIFHVDGLPTRAGSNLPPGELVGRQAPVVTRLRAAGALVLGKTVTTEFAHADPGPTRNPHDLSHTPGGSSSGSAAAVAAGMCPLALGTQTIGSIVRPATFCGVVGLKPSFGRVPTAGVVPVSESADHVGLFTRTLDGMALAAPVCVDDWHETHVDGRPVVGVPDGTYLDQTGDAGRAHFEESVATLDAAGFEIRRVDTFPDIDAINARHERLVAAEAAIAHDEWFERYRERYSDPTAELIETGQAVTAAELAGGRQGRQSLRDRLHAAMDDHGIDVWLSPGALGPAPAGIESTGDPVMNLPWTHAGVPTVAVPTGRIDGLPFGLQCAGRFGADERVLGWARIIADELAE
jgi:Asp-tRNA(Asn)/Glu-tRNA(Gln) amidotransferase A subunit family amidase